MNSDGNADDKQRRMKQIMDTHVATTNQQFTTKKLHPTFGLEITGLDVSGPLDSATVATIKALSEQHKLLVFKNQTLSAADINVFAQHFGNTNQIPPAIAGRVKRQHEISRLGDQDAPEGEKPRPGYGAVARFWHTDSSWRPVPTWLTFLTAVELPDADGATGFADMEAAYNALSDEQKAFLANKNVIHNFITLRRYEPMIPDMDENVPPPATHPLVRTIDGRKSLFLSGHVSYYIGNMPFEQGEALFDELMAHATSPAFVYEHAWAIGDLAMWDDRNTMHRAMPYDTRQRRILYRAEVLGTEAPS
jgi:taurine dioxygenase